MSPDPGDGSLAGPSTDPDGSLAGPSIDAVVAPVFAADERVRFAYLFGSVAVGTARPGSDIDLAASVHPRGTLLDDARLHDALIGALGREDVDLVVLEDAPVWLRHRVVGGRPVYSRDDVARVRHRAAVEMEFLDFQR